MEEYDINPDFREENVKKKAPTFLIVISVLSFVWMAIKLFPSLLALFAGKLTTEQLALQKEEAYESLSRLGALTDEGALQIEKEFEKMTYINDNSFFMHYGFEIIGILIGIYGVIKMLKAQKIGFHLYIIYTLISAFSVFILVPIDMIEVSAYTGSLFIGIIFIFMYSRNLGYMSKESSFL